ncbi:MAG: AAA family ATPase [Cyclobacteriaceae bacterium]
MIEKILIKDVASYDPEEGVELVDLKKLNFFFGANGSGKSTIAKYLSNLCLSEAERDNAFRKCSENGYDPVSHQILVFDENFTENNFNRNALLKGVFSLNSANETIDQKISDEESLIQSFKKSIEKKHQVISSIQDDRSTKEKSLLEFCWSKRDTFSTFSKISLAHSGSKTGHLNNLKKILERPIQEVASIEQLTNRYSQLYESEIIEITASIDINQYKNIRRLERELKSLLNEIIIGNEDVDIASLIKSLNARRWVEEGLYFLEKSNGTCPFCQRQTIDDELRKQFSEFFDDTYTEKINHIKLLLKQYRESTEGFRANILFLQGSHNPSNSVSNVYIGLQAHFEKNIKIIEDKLKNGNERKSLVSLSSFKDELSLILKSIKEVNALYSELDTNKKKLISGIWIFIADTCRSRIDEFASRDVKYNRIRVLVGELIESYNRRDLSARENIERLRSQTVNTKEAVDNINVILKNSGFESFEIDEKEVINDISQYYLKRPNSTSKEPIFKSLSEGEKSFISFLYFFQLCIGTDDIQSNGTKKKIIVIDDPVSSLDSQALFVVSTLIHQLILRKGDDSRSDRKSFKNKAISQVLIFTHNLYFYKEVSFDRRPMCTDYWHYKVEKINSKTFISGQYNKVVLDDYTMLWQTLKELKDNLPIDSALNVAIANTMRRVIESYVYFLGLGKDSWGSLLNEDQSSPHYYVKYAFISSINDESHKVTAMDAVYYQKISNERPQILFSVFMDIFKVIGKDHYEKMMEEEILEVPALA